MVRPHRRQVLELGLGVSAVLLTPAIGRSNGNRPADSLELLVGTYTGGGSKGIYRLQLNRETGQLSQKGLVAELAQPSFLARDPQRTEQVFAVGETNTPGGSEGGTVSLLRQDSDDGWKVVQTQATEGDHPCHLMVNAAGDVLVAANYSGGSYTGFKVGDGQLSEGFCWKNQGSGPNRQRQEGPHGHCVRFIPGDDRRLLAADLGTDEVLLLEVVDAGPRVELKKVSQLKMTAGAGPRQIDFHPGGKWFYVINELNSTLAQVQMPNEQGQMKTLKEVSTLPADFEGNNSTAHVQVHPSGKFAYGSNRGHDSIAVFSLDAKTGAPSLVGHRKTGGRTPRHFLVEPAGKFLLAANQDSDSVVVFPIDSQTGMLGESQFQAFAPRPVCLLPLTR